MELEQVQQAIEPHVPQIIAGAANTFFTALLFGAAAFIWWLIKRRIERQDAEDDERGPALYKFEHDEYCESVEAEHSGKVDQILNAIKEVKDDQEEGFKEFSHKLNRVHARVDETQGMVVSSLQAIISAPGMKK